MRSSPTRCRTIDKYAPAARAGIVGVRKHGLQVIHCRVKLRGNISRDTVHLKATMTIASNGADVRWAPGGMVVATILK